MDTAYLKSNLGDCLSRCLMEVSEKRPRDPIEYMAQWLYKHIENQKYIAAKKKEAEDLAWERKEFEKEEMMREKRKEEAKRLAEQEEERRKLEEERAKNENVSPTKLPPVIEAQEPAEPKTETTESKEEAPKSEEEPKSEEPKSEEPKSEEPVPEPETPKTEEPIQEEQETEEHEKEKQAETTEDAS